LAVPHSSGISALSDLRNHAWAMEPRGTAVREWSVQQCRTAGFEPDVRFEATDLIAHARLVAAGHAAAMLPDLAWTGDRESVRLLDLPGSPVREIFAATRASSRDNATVSTVLDALKEALGAHDPY